MNEKHKGALAALVWCIAAACMFLAIAWLQALPLILPCILSAGILIWLGFVVWE
jgi:hypothetical protein